MARCAVVLCVLFIAACSGEVVDVSVTDCCDASCKATIKQLNYPASATVPGIMKSNGTGTLNADVTDVKMELTVTLSGVRIKDQTVDACSHMHIDFPLKLGSVDIDALKSCPAKPGPIEVDISINNKIALPGPVKAHSVAKDQDGNMLLCLDIGITPRK